MKKKELYIHVGTHKTGSSALQRSLICNQRLLENNDVHFLEYSLLENAHFLRGVNFQQRALLEQERLNLEKKIDRIKENTVILSSEEYFGNLDISYKDARDMVYKLALVTGAYSRKVVVYIRRQDELVESSYAQYIKQGASYSFEEFVKQYDIYQFDWFKLLGAYIEFFGKDNLLIRPYEKQQLFDGDVVKDFYKIIGISSLESLEKHSYSNHGFSRAGLEIARIYNKLYGNNTGKKKRFSNMVQNRMKKNPHDNFHFFSYQARLEILGFYEKSNEQVATEYLHRKSGVLFDEDLRKYQYQRPRKNRFTVSDLMTGIAVLFLEPVKLKLWRVLRKFGFMT